MINILALVAGLATSAMASPAPASYPTAPSRFVIHFSGATCDSNSVFSANVAGGNSGAIFVQGLPISQSNGTPASLNGTSTNATLIFEDSSVFRPSGDGAFLDPSDEPGVTNVISLVPGFSQFGWGRNGNVLTHQKRLPQDQFFSCLYVVDGNIVTALKYGAPYANGTLPAFCQKTTPYIVAL